MALDSATRHRMLEYGAAAPSGDNMQPWMVEWRGDMLHLAIDPSRDRSLYNFEYRASHIALGAMIENIAIAARQSGFESQIALSPTDGDVLSAAITFRPADVRPDPLFPFVLQRCTNRRLYRPGRIASDQLQALSETLPKDGSAEMRFIEDARQRRILARAASLNDRLLFENRPLHDGFFETIRWSAREAEASRDGLFVKTLELGPMSLSFKAMRSWTAVRIMNLLGASRTAPFHSFRTFMHSAAFGFLQMTGAPGDRSVLVHGGRVLQRVWLTTTSLGMGFQPMAGMLYLLPYLNQRSDRGPQHRSPIAPSQRSVIERAERLFKQILPLDDRRAAIMLFRIGYGAPPSATSLRRSLALGQTT